MTTCPKCGFQGPDPDQCARCGIIYDRMRTILEVEPLGPQLQAAVAERRRAQGTTTPAASPDAKTVEVAPHAGTPDALAEAFPHLRRGPLSPPRASPTREPTLPPGGKAPLVMVERPEARRRPLLLGVLAFVLLLLLVDQWLDRSREAARAAATPPAPAEEVVDATYLNLALEGMLGEARRELRRVDDPAHVEVVHGHLIAQAGRLRLLLPRAALPEARHAAYEESITQLQRFLGLVSEALALAQAPGARPEPVDVGPLLAAEAAFATARSAP